MEVVRLPKGRTVARLVLTRSGENIRAVMSVKGAMQSTSEFDYFESVEKAEAHAKELAERRLADVLYIEDQT